MTAVPVPKFILTRFSAAHTKNILKRNAMLGPRKSLNHWPIWQMKPTLMPRTRATWLGSWAWMQSTTSRWNSFIRTGMDMGCRVTFWTGVKIRSHAH